MTINVTMTVNGTQVSHDIEPRMLLVHFIRETLELTGTHWGCDTSNCGACVVRIDGQREAIRLNNGLAASLFVMPPVTLITPLARPSPDPQPSSLQISASQKHPAKPDKPRRAIENRPPTSAPDESNNVAGPSRTSSRHRRAVTPKSR